MVFDGPGENLSPPAIFGPVKTVRPAQGAGQQIGEAIRHGYFDVGARLPSERELSSLMHISRPTLREAIRQLVAEGVLEVRSGAGGGIFVKSDLVPTAFVRDWPGLLRPDDVEGVLAARRLIEPRVAQLAAAMATDTDRESIKHAIRYQDKILADASHGTSREKQVQFTLADTRFHMALARATGNSAFATERG